MDRLSQQSLIDLMINSSRILSLPLCLLYYSHKPLNHLRICVKDEKVLHFIKKRKRKDSPTENETGWVP